MQASRDPGRSVFQPDISPFRMTNPARFSIILILCTIAVGAAIWNATLIYDDQYVPIYFSSLEQNSVWIFLREMLLNLDRSHWEYRLYGLSRLIHDGLFHLFHFNPIPYSVVIVGSQICRDTEYQSC